MPTTVVWFRQDLRIADNPALLEAAERGEVVPVYVVEDTDAGAWVPGGAGRWWRGESLRDLDCALQKLGSRLIVLEGPAADALERVADATGATGVVWNRRYDPDAVCRDRDLKSRLRQRGLEVWSCNGSLLFEPWQIKTLGGDPYKIFTPFARTCLKFSAPRQPLAAPERLRSPKVPSTLTPRSIESLCVHEQWTGGLAETWQPGSLFSINNLADFLEDKVEDYGDNREKPFLDGTSRLSPRLHFGEISPHQVWHATVARCGGAGALDPGTGSEAFLRELLWREFGHHILFHFPHLPTEPLRAPFRRFPWADDKTNRNAWRFGRTGYPIVDAGMRQLRLTGWMHNRVRMITGSFLVKHLLEHWLHGARWFWDNLVDADLASNTLGWQWVAGSGPDAAPYFRIFNPVRQGEKFDPEGHYVRRWVPELGTLPASHIHAPWEAPGDVLARGGVRLGETYPTPIVDHKHARARALDALETIKHSA